ncbi:MAG TPA: ParA family protein [Steroidobacteraceae bacterium]|nr:ParA family protein [Steroidobacteraceae bacterium]
MRVVTVINAKGGCSKSTIAMNLAAALAGDGYRTLLLDLDPQAQLTAWLGLGDGLDTRGTIVLPLAAKQPLSGVIQTTQIANLYFVASAQPLEDLGRQMTEEEGYQLRLTELLAEVGDRFELCVIDSPNQISPVMENAIFPAHLFVVPFESTKAVKSYANVEALVQRMGGEAPSALHVLSNLSRLPGQRKRVIDLIAREGIGRAVAEIRSCGWLAQVDEHGGSIFHFRPHANGAKDLLVLKDQVLVALGLIERAGTQSVDRPQLAA